MRVKLILSKGDALRAQRVPRFETIERHSSSPQSRRHCDRPRCAIVVANAGTATMCTTAEHVVHRCSRQRITPRCCRDKRVPILATAMSHRT